jgi:uncharacterized membrane protein (DUF106 family)
MLDFILDPIFSPLLKLSPLFAILIVSFGFTLLLTLVYKWMTDQHMMKSLKDEMKGHREEMKKHKDNPQKVMELNKKSMEANMKYMMHSMKPTLITFIPIIIIFGWLNAHMTYMPIMPGQEFSTTITFYEGVSGKVELDVPEGIKLLSDAEQEISNSQISWKLNGEEGVYESPGLKYIVNEKEYSKDLLITSKQEYKVPVKVVNDGTVKSVQINQKSITPFGNMSLFGWHPGWIGTYIIFSIVFSIVIRKLLKVH